MEQQRPHAGPGVDGSPEEEEEEDGAELDRKILAEPIYQNVAAATTASQPADAGPEVVPSPSRASTHTYRDQEPSQGGDSDVDGNGNGFPAAAEALELPRAPAVELQPEPAGLEDEPYYQVPKSSEPYYDAPKHLRPVPVYENIEVFYSGLENATLAAGGGGGANAFKMEPPKEKPPPPPTDSPPAFDDDFGDDGIETNTYETISGRLPSSTGDPHPSPPIKRMNSTKRIKKELRHKRSSFLGLEGSADDDLESYLELTVAPPPDMAQLLQEERRLEKQLYLKAGLCDSSDTGESRDSGVSENHSRQSSEPFTTSSEEADRPGDDGPLSLSLHTGTGSGTGNGNGPGIITNASSGTSLKREEEFFYQNDPAQLLAAAQTPLLQTAKGTSAESWTESATEAAAATQSLTEATATANAKMFSIEEKIREQEEVLRVERELLQLEQEELKRQRENLMLRENLARRELQHGAKMLMSANRHSLQDLNGGGGTGVNGGFGPVAAAPQPPQQIYANVPSLPQAYYQVETDYRKSMSDLNEFSKRLMLAPVPPTKPLRSMHVSTAGGHEDYAGQLHPLNAQGYGGSLVKIAGSSVAPQRQSAGAIYTNYQLHQSAQNLVGNGHGHAPHGHAHMTSSNMTRNTLHALSATPKPKYTDGWVQVQNRKSFDSNLANDPAWLSAYQQKRKSVPDAYHYNNNHWLVQEAEQRRLAEQHPLRSVSASSTPAHQPVGVGGVAKVPVPASAPGGNGKPLPDSIIQTLTERVQSKGIGERKRFEAYNNHVEKGPLHTAAAASFQHHSQHHPPPRPQQQQMLLSRPAAASNGPSARHPLDLAPAGGVGPSGAQDKVLSVSGKKKCSHCGDELGRGAAMIIESLLLFYHINCFKCCVCHVQLGDGLNGTDVRVRNHKLHCQNCYSSDDGIKFSCV